MQRNKRNVTNATWQMQQQQQTDQVDRPGIYFLRLRHNLHIVTASNYDEGLANKIHDFCIFCCLIQVS